MADCSENEWSRTKLVKLIHLYRSREVLWNSKYPSFKDKILKNLAWGEIAAELDVNQYEVQNKVKNLLTCFRREEKKLERGVPGKWWAFESMLFLKDNSTPRKITETAISGDERNAQEQESDERDRESDKGNQNQLEILLATPGASPSSSVYSNPPAAKRIKHSVFQNSFESGESSFSETNEFRLFGEYVSSQVEKIRSARQRSILKRKILNLLSDAELAQADNDSNIDLSSIL
ncbi:uncharacterized protein LOC111048084 isoform X2 [Nilaparvata lugens]|uniref:uncharacterized protein LOC111048084 isoform X2 n=1 Tax=Nilaparvata lugens TaxID=108931 RepID=UPI000B98A7B4|nr:uncharacterized protein LOC111048084 isoform X2 [Nilaparvata lugens]XP_039280273.1 uncharacterized protein LOC111048084 isoform X2 [Nilaparvata lugens]